MSDSENSEDDDDGGDGGGTGNRNRNRGQDDQDDHGDNGEDEEGVIAPTSFARADPDHEYFSTNSKSKSSKKSSSSSSSSISNTASKNRRRTAPVSVSGRLDVDFTKLQSTWNNLITNNNISSNNNTRDSNLESDYFQVQNFRMRKFPYWHMLLRAGFNLLLFGFGSKRQLIEDFVQSHCISAPVVHVMGYHPLCSIKEILALISDAFGISQKKRDSSFEGQIAAIQHHLLLLLDDHSSTSKHHHRSKPHSTGAVVSSETVTENDHNVENDDIALFVVIHNIDGERIRDSKSQELLSILADIRSIRFICSVDHVNASFMWTREMATKFHFVHEDATTYAYYNSELVFENDRAVAQVNLQGVLNVLTSLGNNQRELFRLLAQHKLDNPNSGGGGGGVGGGMLFSSLVEEAKKRLIGTQRDVINKQLQGLLDHNIVRIHGQRGKEYLSVTLQPAEIAFVLDRMR